MKKHTVLFKNTTISFSDSGKGTALVLLHGFLENSTMWDSFQELWSKKYRLICIDLLGHGQSECLGYVHTMEDNADVVHAVLQELKIRKALLVGHSMGGYVALAFAELYTENVKGLVLLNSTSRADSPEKQSNRDRAILAVKQNYTNFVRIAISNLFSENNRERLETAIEQVKLEALQTPLQGIIASLEGMKIRKDREVMLHFAPFPLLLVLGKQDPILPYNDQLAQLEGTRVQLATFPDGHMTLLENREESAAALLAFFKSCT